MAPDHREGIFAMRVGISSLAAIRWPLAEVEQEIARFGVGAEVLCEAPHAWPPPVPWSQDNLLALHAPILGVNIASTNPGIREESVLQVLEVVREAARLGASGVVVHPGAPPYQELLPREYGLPHAIESLRRCAGAAQEAGLEIYMENLPAISLAEGMKPLGFSYGVTYEELRYIFDSVAHPALRLCLDIGHAYLAGREVLEAMLADRDVVHVHVSDNFGRRDDHAAWGDGEVSKVVDLSADLPPSVRAVVFEHLTLEACATSLERVFPDGRLGESFRPGGGLE